MKANAGKSNACDYCAAFFDSADALAAHCINLHASFVRPHACATCAASFSSARNLAFHEAMQHPKELAAASSRRHASLPASKL